jgi:hypothetical protein
MSQLRKCFVLAQVRFLLFRENNSMDNVTLTRAMEAFCRQRARMEGENERFWLIETTHWRNRAAAPKFTTTLEATLAPSLHPDGECRNQNRPPA